MFDHVNIGVSDLKKSRAFYERALGPLGIVFVMSNQSGVGFGRGGHPRFWISLRGPAGPVHISFASPDRATVDLFHREALAVGGRDNGPPGLRPQYHPSYYGAFVLVQTATTLRRSHMHPSDPPAGGPEAANPAAILAHRLRTTMWPQLSVRKGREAVDFYRAAFGAVEVYRVGGTDEHEDVVAQLTIGDASFWVADESPEHKNFSPESVGGGTVRMLLVVPDPRGVVERAVAVGATEVYAPQEAHGWLVGRIEYPFGHNWEIAKPLGDWPPPHRPGL